VGILEFQVDNRDAELRRAMAEYSATVAQRPPVKTLRQVRTIPLRESVEAPVEVLSYEQAEALIAAQTQFAVAACVCRRGATERGHGCDAPEESCLMFGEWAELYVRGGRGRAIDRDEVRQIIARADAHNLVLQPSNSREIAFLCCCCGCCCGVLRELKSTPKPAEAAATSFAARLDVAQCLGCLVCLERCQMEALTQDGDVVALNGDRCIGCGLCVSTCPSSALTLARKPAPKPVPETMQETWRIIAGDQAAQR
jgi:Fe-S-cluster-containing hydrogenase component 2